MTDAVLSDPRPLLAVLVSFVAAFLIVASYRSPNVREGWTLVASLAKFGIVASMLPAVLDGAVFEWSAGAFLPGIGAPIEFALRADALGMLFAFLASGLWIITSFYSIGYMRGLDEPNQTRYFAAFAVSLAATMGIAFAGNLVTIFVFYELLSIATYPLVAHDETAEARSAGRKYLAYTMFGGGVLVLAGTALVYLLAGSVDFTAGGIAALANADPGLAMLAFFLLAIGFGVKAGIMPLHQWLPEAMVAPTPVSGLLHAVAVVKSGAFGVSRVVLDVFGPELVYNLSLPFGFTAGLVLSTIGAITLTAASLIALRKDHLKRRLAYSTISQLSYIILGLGLFGWYGLVGALLHIPAHAFMKLTLFFCAGNIHVSTHTDYISQMAGIGKRMPLTMGAFTIASLGMAGIPLLAGFVSKYYMLIGGVRMGMNFTPVAYYLVGALLLSGVLNIAYFWPVIYTAFFEAEDAHDAKPLVDFPLGGESRSIVAATDGGRAGDGDADQNDDDHEGSADDVEDIVADAGDGDDPSSEAADGVDESDIPDADLDDLPTDEEGVVRPDFAASERDFSEPAERVDTGDYAVDERPSDADVPFGPGRADPEESASADAVEADRGPDDPHGDHDDDPHGGHDADTHDDGHHGGPPAGGWKHIAGLDALRGRESTWFTLGPILAAMTLAVLLGVIPYEMGFLELIELIVDTRLPEGVVRP
ncbi:monovalent cation/H+ antiporter subunit D [Halorubrum distributum JCM 9100]|uniref:Monovalent cation/H+ antiporter subunit D n=3 Tax=Halorubrum distributum TaxID=29283 RepID=M0EIS3_9EURY|nr:MULTISPECIES: cation:proton antiporter [Halorubrum distributum group]ELZ47645.1 monovalent cation/H+ antiporter subunit D [Halorubrum distributum JCM 9100]ELZ52790.1 monovalent cation/H+ antiporter subunit D [Halorubrum distributum JCM 10118]EMA62752.1 monovalent cation/H+ antiporter subunit D [Halorubrum litoreum JCM 13561]